MIPDPIRRITPTVELATEMGGVQVDDLAHACHVAHLAGELFALTWPMHGLGDAEAHMLRRAALLHDAGILIAYRRHHKHSMHIIKRATLPGLTPQEQLEVACIARYHRRALPNKRHAIFRDLSPVARRRVAELGGILRLADAFDYEHDGGISHLYGHVLSSTDQPVHVLIRAEHHITDHAALQRVMQQAQEKRNLFERAFHARVSISLEAEKPVAPLNGKHAHSDPAAIPSHDQREKN